MLDNIHIKSGDKISTYNIDFMCYASQLGWGNSVLCHCYYQGLPNQIQDPISTQKQGKPILFQIIYALVMTINHCYYKYDYHKRQVEKETLESHFWKQGKAFSTSNATVSQNKTNIFLAALFAKSSSSKPFLFSTPKRQFIFLQVDLSSKLANNGKLTSDKCKKHFENNLCLYCSIEDYKLDSCPKDHSTSATADLLAAVFKKLLKK